MSAPVGLLAFVVFLLVLILALHVICLAMPYYETAMNLGSYLSDKTDLASYRSYYPNMDANYGFWKMCMNIYSSTVCYNLGMEEDANSSTIKAPDWIIVCQALSIAGLIVGVLGVAFSILSLCRSSTCLLVAGSMSAIIGGIVIIIANIVFATQKSMTFIFLEGQINDIFGSPDAKYVMNANSAFQFGWSFGTDIATGVMCVLIGALFGIWAAINKNGNLYISKTMV